MSLKTSLQICAVLVTLVAVGVVAVWMTVGGNRTIFLVGKTSDAHHQIELACETCHAAPVFSSAAKAKKAMNKACRDCHGDELKTADDSHPRKKFRNPRMAAYWETLDARFCTTCHAEHHPEITRKGAVTVAVDFCVACHAEGDQDIRTVRPSHADLTFDTCASAGCHNYHDNRALYADFLVKHADQPWLHPTPVHALSARHRTRQSGATAPLGRQDALAPVSALTDATVLDHWAGSGHAAADINCTDCHAPDAASGAPLTGPGSRWTAVPSLTVCRDCHREQSETFALGRHGMRQHPGIAPPRDPTATAIGAVLPGTITAWIADPPYPALMTVDEARLPMRDEAAHQLLDCGTCHQPHAVDIRQASVEACASCHNDAHSRSYAGSPHHLLWQAEQAGDAAPSTGVSCATCHMTRIERRGKIITSHNQNDSLRPVEKMIRPVCLDCHGLPFSIDALADTDLVNRNFRGRPGVHIESIDWALQQAASAPNTEH